jgi:hypothetical protein
MSLKLLFFSQQSLKNIYHGSPIIILNVKATVSLELCQGRAHSPKEPGVLVMRNVLRGHKTCPRGGHYSVDPPPRGGFELFNKQRVVNIQ